MFITDVHGKPLIKGFGLCVVQTPEDFITRENLWSES